MSVQAMAWALDLELCRVSDPTARHVLLVLSNYAGEDGRAAFPSVETLSRQTGLSERTIRYKLDLLQEIGVIKLGKQAIAAAYIDRADRRPSVYDVDMSKRPVEVDGVQQMHPENGTGCKSRQNGVQMVQERGAPAAPNPSLNPSLIHKSKKRGRANEYAKDDRLHLIVDIRASR